MSENKDLDKKITEEVETIIENTNCEAANEENNENASDESSFAAPMVDDVQEKLKSEKEKFLRLFADFENYKKRTMKERLSLMESANKELMVAILPTLDDFERAITELKKNEEHEAQLQGVYLIYNKLNSTVTQKGLAKVAVEKGDVFNAEIHEAITQITAPTEDLKGKIIDVIENGYKLGEKIIRFPKVIVGA